MKSVPILLSPPHMCGLEQKYLQDAFASNWIAPAGTNLSAFENKLTSFLHTKSEALALNSGTSAIHLGLLLLGVQPSDEVICQSFTFIASVNPVSYIGATPVFVDSELATWNMCPIALEKAILHRIAHGKKPKAIILVHLYGMPASLDAILSIAAKYDIPVVEDAAEALGSTYKSKPCGTFGTIGVFSFNGNKIITTSAGGALIVPNTVWKAKALFLATQAKEVAPYYEHATVGFNYRMSNICAAIGCGQLDVLAERVAQRRAVHAFYSAYFLDKQEVEVLEEPSEAFVSNHWLTCILLKNAAVRDALQKHLANENIESRLLWKPMHLQPIFKSNLYFGTTISADLFAKGLCLPSGSQLSTSDLTRLKTVLDSFF
uniref:DegT/DnrJ/EryC1/StrS family aminotransferase n=1 Tax=Flavobacterium sp. TaxID=239 RepID=UPI00404A858B